MHRSTLHRMRTLVGLVMLIIGLMLVPRPLESSARSVLPVVLLAVGLCLVGTVVIARFTFSRARRVLREAHR